MIRRRRDREAGAVAVLTVFLFLAFIAGAGLVVDAGYALAARRQAADHAEAAARAGADALDEASLRAGPVYVDPDAAAAAAEAYLDQVDATGTVSVDGAMVTVTVSDDQPTSWLSAVGVDSLHVTETASAQSIDETDQP